MFAERKLKEGEVIGVFAAVCREKSDIEGCNKVTHVVTNVFGTLSGDDMVEFLRMGKHCINDCAFWKKEFLLGDHNCDFFRCKDVQDTTSKKLGHPFLVVATKS